MRLALVLIICAGLSGCAMKGTKRDNLVPEWVQWAKDPAVFPDGAEREHHVYCATVYKDAATDVWLADVRPDWFHDIRRYHTKEAAVHYVEEWCRP